MLFEALDTLTTELNNYVQGLPDSEQNFTVEEGNVAFADTTESRIIMSLIRLEEEATLKNIHQYEKQAGRTVYKYPPVNMNLYILCSVVSSQYRQSMKNLSNVVRFFQAKKIFNASNTPNQISNISLDFELFVDLYSPSFDMINQIWGSLGGKQYPSVMYKVRLVSIERDNVIESRPLITNINGDLNNLQ